MRKNFLVAEKMEEYALAYAEVAYENTGEHAPMGFMEPDKEI